MEESTMQQALRTWVRTHSKLEDKKIVWAEQASVRLATPFITMRIGDLVPLGSADEEANTYDEDAPEGEEIELLINGRRQFSLSVQVFGDGDESARQALSRVQTATELPSVQALFSEASLSCFDKGTIQNLTALLETDFEPRAQCDFQFYCSESVSEKTTFIQTVELENDFVEPPTTFEITIEE